MSEAERADRVHRRAADRLLAHTIGRGGRWFAAVVAAQAGIAVSTLLTPAAVADAVDAALGRGDPGRAVLIFGAVLTVGILATLLLELAEPYAVARSTVWLRTRLLDRVLALGVVGQRRFDSGDLITRLGSNAAVAATAGAVVLTSMVGLVTSVGAVVALGLIDPLLAGVFLLGLPVGLALIAVFVRQSAELYTHYQGLQAAMASRLVDAMAGIRTIRSAGTAAREVERVLDPLPELGRTGHGTWRLQASVTWRVQLLAPLLEVGVLAVAGYQVVAGRLSPGDLLAAAGYVAMALLFFAQANLLIALSRARAAARRVQQVLTEPPMAPQVGTAPAPTGGGELVLHAVTVREDGKAVLDALDLRVPPGCAVAVVGRSGAGKSTLAAVAGRLLEPDEGEVLLDGTPLSALDTAGLRAAVGYAFERPQLLGDTVLDAIGYGSGAPDKNRLVAAAKLVHADEFVRRLPAGYDTPLADAPFSGGEVQRIGLARATNRDRRLLIMDDATSSLDTVTEAQVGAALTEALAGRSRLLVAHRAGTAARADLVAWLEAGRVRALAPHGVLWQYPDYRAVFAADADPADVDRAEPEERA